MTMRVAWPAAFEHLDVAAMHGEPAVDRRQRGVDPLQVLHDRQVRPDSWLPQKLVRVRWAHADYVAALRAPRPGHLRRGQSGVPPGDPGQLRRTGGRARWHAEVLDPHGLAVTGSPRCRACCAALVSEHCIPLNWAESVSDLPSPSRKGNRVIWPLPGPPV